MQYEMNSTYKKKKITLAVSNVRLSVTYCLLEKKCNVRISLAAAREIRAPSVVDYTTINPWEITLED